MSGQLILCLFIFYAFSPLEGKLYITKVPIYSAQLNKCLSNTHSIRGTKKTIKLVLI